MTRKTRGGEADGWTVAVLAVITAVLATAAGCNTTEGVGKDIESAGDGIEDAAREARE